MDKLNLADFISKNNILTRPLGVNYKRERSSFWNIRLTILFLLCYADLIHNLIMSLFSFKTHRREKMLYGDISVVAFDENHNQITIAQYCYRLSSGLMLTIFVFDKRVWLK